MGVVIFFVFFEVWGQFVDVSGQQCDLNFGGVSVVWGVLEFGNDVGFDFSGECYFKFFFMVMMLFWFDRVSVMLK